jgi:hypothetical protein
LQICPNFVIIIYSCIDRFLSILHSLSSLVNFKQKIIDVRLFSDIKHFFCLLCRSR